MEENILEIPLLNNISDALSVVNCELQSYCDLFHDEEIHYPYSLKQAIINLSNCLELLIKYRLLAEHWAFIFDDVNKANETSFDSGDFISVSFIKGIERLKNICKIDIDRYFKFSRELYKLRNKLVHYTLTDSLKNVLSIIDGSIIELYAFVSEEIVNYIDNDNAIKDIMADLKELTELNKSMRSFSGNLDNK